MPQILFLFAVLFGLYADDNLMIQKERIDAAVLATDGDIPESLSELFEHVSYDILALIAVMMTNDLSSLSVSRDFQPLSSH